MIWLIEYVGATPKPVYVPYDYHKTHGNYTLDAWEAKRFASKEEAETYMANPDGCLSYGPPWAAVGHSFDDGSLV